MNKNKKSKTIILLFVDAIILVGGVFLFILERMIDLNPNVIREKFGDAVMEWLLSLPLPYIFSFFVISFFIVFIFLLWINGVFETNFEIKNEVSESPQTTNIENQQNISDNGIAFQNPVFHAPVTFNPLENKKKDDEISKARIEVKEFHLNSEGFQSYGQAVKVGIYVNNSDKYNIVPYARLVGVLKRTKTMLDEKTTENNLPFDEDKSIFQYDKEVFTKIKKIYFMEVVKNRYISILFEKPVAIEFFSETEEPDFRSITWDFDFEICGQKKNGEQFQNGNYHAQIECRTVNGEFFLCMSVL